MNEEPKLPGGPLARRPLHFIFLADCSSSMWGEKIQQLNHAIAEAIPHMRDVADGNPNAEVLVRAIRFSSNASWHIAQPTPVESFNWVDSTVNGTTAMGEALSLAATALEVANMPERALPPVLVLVSDGEPTDNFGKGLDALMDQPWGKKAVRIGIAIGGDADEECLQRFVGHREVPVLRANNAQALTDYIRWASTAVLSAASAPASQTTPRTNSSPNVPLPIAPPPVDPNDVW